MRTIKEQIQFDEEVLQMLNESVYEKHMTQLLKQLKKFDIAPKKFIESVGFAIDKIDASRVKVYVDPDSGIDKKVKAATDDKNKCIFFIKDGMICCAYGKFTSVTGRGYNEQKFRMLFFPTDTGEEYDNWYKLKFTHFARKHLNGASDPTTKNILEFSHKCDEIWIVDFSGDDLATEKLKRDRKNAQYGVWDNTPEFYAKYAEKNLERYKQMVAKMRMEKGSDVSELMQEIEKWVKVLTDTLMDMHRNMSPGKWGMDERASSAASDFNQAIQNVLSRVGDLLRAQKDYEDSKRWAGITDDTAEWGGGYYLKEYRRTIDYCKEYLERAEKYYNALQEIIKKYK